MTLGKSIWNRVSPVNTGRVIAVGTQSVPDSAESLPADHDSPAYRLRLREACATGAGDEHAIDFDGTRFRCFFLSGCFKSGTNWIGALLNLHPEVLCRGEFHFNNLLQGFDGFTGRPWFVANKPWIKPYADESLRASVRTMLLASTRDKPTARWLGDRTPRRLEVLLPGAPNLYIHRDGRDVLVSWAFHWLRAGRNGWAVPGFRDVTGQAAAQFEASPDLFRNNPSIGLLADDAWVRTACREWAERVTHDLPVAEKLKSEGTPVLVIRYEDLHARFAELRINLYRFLNLDPALAAAPSQETRTLPGFKSESPESKHRKGMVGDWRNYFDERLTRIFKQETGEQLVRLGYEKDLNW